LEPFQGSERRTPDEERGLLVTLTFGFGLTLALLWVLGIQRPLAVAALGIKQAKVSNAPAAELHVCLSGCAYSSVQAAVDAASDGDVIKVAVGTYNDVHVRPVTTLLLLAWSPKWST